MTRLAVLRRHPKRTLAGLTVALAAVGVAVGSGATFNSSDSQTTNTFTAGRLVATASSSGAAFTTTFDDLKPGFGTTDGDSDTPDIASTSEGFGSFTVENTGTIAGTFELSASSSGTAYTGDDAAAVCQTTCSALDEALRVSIYDDSPTPAEVFDGTLSQLATASLWTGAALPSWTLAEAADKTYNVYFYLPNSTTDAYQGGTADATLNVTAVQQ
jgi:hypothetical protein